MTLQDAPALVVDQRQQGRLRPVGTAGDQVGRAGAGEDLPDVVGVGREVGRDLHGPIVAAQVATRNGRFAPERAGRCGAGRAHATAA